MGMTAISQIIQVLKSSINPVVFESAVCSHKPDFLFLKKTTISVELRMMAEARQDICWNRSCRELLEVVNSYKESDY